VSKTTLDLLLILGLTALFYGQPILNPALTSLGGDGFSLFVPAFAHYMRSMFEGVVPLWNSYNWMGAPFLASYQCGVLYPPNLASLIFNSPDHAVNFSLFLSVLWLSVGSYFFGIRALRLDRTSCLLMAVCMGCSGFVGGHIDHVNQLAAIAWIPWIIGEALILLRRPRIRGILILGFSVCMQILAGHPQYVLFTLIFLFILSFIYLVYFQHRRRTEDPPSWLGMVFLLVAIAGGAGMSSAQLLPSAELSQYSWRQMDEPGYMFAYSYPPRNLITLVYPNAFGNPVTGLHDLTRTPLAVDHLGMFENDSWVRAQNIGSETAAFNYDEWVVYVGLFTVFFAVYALISLWREFVVRCFLFLVLFSLLMAFGSYVPISRPPYQLLLEWLPGGGHMRVPARFLVFFNFSLVVLAAVGFNQATLYLRERKRIPVTTLAPLRFLIVIIIFFDLHQFSTNQVFRHFGSSSVLREKGPVRRFFEENMGEYRVFRQLTDIPYDTDREGVLKMKGVKEYSTRLQMQRFQPNLNLVDRIQVERGYFEGLLPTMSWQNFNEKYRRNLHSDTPDTHLMGLMNIKYLVTDSFYSPTPHLAPISRFYTLPLPLGGNSRSDSLPLSFEPLSDDLWPTLDNLTQFMAIFSNRNFCPKFVWARRLEPIINIKSLDVSEKGIDPRSNWGTVKTPVYDYRRGREQWEAKEGHAPGMADLSGGFDYLLFHRKDNSPNAFVVQKSPEDSGKLLMLEAAYPGWVCRSEREAVPLRRENAIMMSCAAPKDAGSLEIRYEPFSFRLGFFLSCCSVLFMSALALFVEFPRNTRRQPFKRLMEYIQRSKPQ
jgi:hypothetical protein